MRSTVRIGVAVGLLVAGLGAVSASAQIVVNTTTDELNAGGSCSLREAIQLANGDATSRGCGTIVQGTITLPAGTYTLGIAGQNEDNNATGDLDVSGTVTINGAGSGTTIVQAGTIADDGTGGVGNGLDRVFDVPNGGSLTLNDLTVRNGLLNGPGLYSGGINVFVGSLTLNEVVVSHNTILGTSADAAGIGVTDGTATITNSTITNNFSGVTGGGMTLFVDAGFAGSAILTNSTVSSNTAGSGGGINIINNASSAQGTLTITNSTISNNAAIGSGGQGGGLSNANGTVTITNSTVSGNTALSAGGDGGGIHMQGLDPSVTITNSTFSNNAANAEGGAIRAFNDVTIRNSTFAGNSAGSGAGLHLLLGTVVLQNSIITGSAGDDCAFDGGSFSGGSTTNLIDDMTCVGADRIGAVSGFSGSLADNGGPTLTHAILGGSNAEDAGDATVCANNGITEDQRGYVRDAACDVGAFEAGSIALGPLDGPGGSPIAEPVAVPAAGGSVYFAAAVTNPGAAPLVIDTWPSLTFPDGTVLVKRRPNTQTLAPGETLDILGAVHLQAAFPAGTYTFTGYAGTYPSTIVGQATIAIEKAAARSGAPALTAAEIAALDFDDLVVFDVAGAATSAEAPAVPADYALGAAYPNPFNPMATIPYAVPEAADVRLAVYDVLGREVARLVDGRVEAGAHAVVLDGRGLPSGTYLVRLVAGSHTQTRRVTLLK